MKKSLYLGSCGAIAAATLLVATPAAATGSPTVSAGPPTTITTGLVSPLSLEVDAQRVSYVTQNFTGVLTRVERDGTTSTLAAAPGEEISAVSSRDGYVYYAQLAMDHSSAHLMKVPAGGGTPATVADLYAWEATNPDAAAHYGFQGLTPECAAQFPPAGGEVSPPAYTGLVDTHPYASLALHNAVFIADAGANAIARVSYSGAVSTLAVLPPAEPITATAELLEASQLPACAAGTQYIAEPVPTDIEIGPDGWLYVTTLPGGPEDASLGARGSVYKINQKTGEVVKVAGGFVTATGLAVSTNGTIYVSEIHGGPTGTGQISVLAKGATTPVPLTAVSQPSAIELRADRLFVTTDSLSETGGASLSLIRVTGKG